MDTETLERSQQIGQALSWLVGLLEPYSVPYQVVGGLAARAYGANRPLVDIDLYMPFERASAALAEMQPFIVRPAGPGDRLPRLCAGEGLRGGGSGNAQR